MTIDELIARVRRALAGVEAPPLPSVPAVLATAPEPSPDAPGDLVATFIAAARRAGAEVSEGEPSADLAGAERADPTVAVTEVAAAIALTGTLVLEGAPRLPSALCETHVAVVRRDQILPTLSDYLSRPTAARARVLVTGPSKTADIEGILVTGVHGPRRLVIRVV